VVSLLSDGLSERGHDVTLFATGDSSTKARLEYAFDRAPGPEAINSPWEDAAQALLAFGDPSRFDVFHVHTPWSALAAGVASGRPMVLTLHGPFSEEMGRLCTLAGDRAWFVAISEDQRRHRPGIRYAGVVHNGIDTDAYPMREGKEDFLFFLGRAAPEKGLLRAVLAAREAGMRLVVAVKLAQPEELDHWEREVKPALAPDTEVLREIPFDQKADLLSRARAVLFPIDWDEPFGLVMVEAMACGTPVVATPRGAAPEVVADGETGFLVSVEDYPREAAAALRRIADVDPSACRARVERLFSKAAMVEGYERVFKRVVESGP
jgi:glycosyltransferase involved in cell wall biosynthesis